MGAQRRPFFLPLLFGLFFALSGQAQDVTYDLEVDVVWTLSSMTASSELTKSFRMGFAGTASMPSSRTMSRSCSDPLQMTTP